MKMIVGALLVIGASLSGCSPGLNDDNLSSVPVTNNPNLIPRSGQTAQGPSFGN